MLRVLTFLGVLSLVAGASHAQGFGSGPTLVRVAPATTEQITDVIDALGSTRANESTEITATVTEKVVSINFTDGQKVAEGDVLVRLDMAEEQANMSSAQASLKEAQSAFDRAQALERKRAGSRAEVDERRAALAAAKAEIAALQSRIADRVLRAPFAGTVGFRQVSPGALVRPGDVITTLTDTETLKLDFTLPALDLSAVRVGLAIKATAQAYGADTFGGTVQSISPAIDPVTRAVTVRAVLPNPDGRLRPGMLMLVSLQKNPREALMVPEAALVQSGRHVFVYTIAEGKAERHQIEIGTRKPGRVEVLSGLALGDEVITHGTHKIRPGQAVTVAPAEG